MSIDTSTSSTDEEERRIERLSDQGVATNADAERRVLEHERLKESAGRVMGDVAFRDIKSGSKPHYSHRGGRSYPDPTDSELDSNWKAGDAPIKFSEEETQIQRDGIALVRAVGEYVARPNVAALSKEDHERAVNEFIEDFKRMQHESAD